MTYGRRFEAANHAVALFFDPAGDISYTYIPIYIYMYLYNYILT